MNMTRRKFFRGVAIGLPTALVAAKLPAVAADTTSMITATWSPTTYKETIYHSLPTDTWRQFYASPAGRRSIRETNEILAELKWIEK